MDATQIRKEILSLSERYFEATKKTEAFLPGKNYIPASGKLLGSDDLGMLMEASLDMWLTAGRFSVEFEGTLPRYLGRQAGALLVNSGSSANLLAISSLGSPLLKSFGMKPLEKGDEIITVAAGFPTTVNPIVQNGWIPVFVDVDYATLNALPEKVFSARSNKTRAVVLAHTLGNPYRADLIAEWCKKENLYFIEDCCDALGASIQSQPAGSFSDYATLSFYPAHHITMGEGGAVISKDGRLKRVAESLRDWGRDCWCEPGRDNSCGKRFGWKLGGLPDGYDHKYTYSSVGYNLKATDMQAAIGISQLKKLESFVQKRRENWKLLNTAFQSSPILKEKLIPVSPTPHTNPSWFGFPIHCASGIQRERVTKFLEENKVGTRLVFAGNLTRQPAYQDVDYKIIGELTNTDEIMRNSFWIGLHPSIGSEHIDYMVSQLEKAVSRL